MQRYKTSPLVLAISLAFWPVASALAQDGAPAATSEATASTSQPTDRSDKPTAAPNARVLDPVTVVGSLSAASSSERADSAVAIDAVDLSRRQARDLKDALRYVPGVSVSQGSGRFGIGDVRIRGLGGNRVRQQVDGVELSDSFAIGSFSSAGRDFIDPSLLKRIELYRGSASALYGSDAIGGVVTYTTLDPEDLLSDQATRAAARTYASSDDDSYGGNAWWAGQSGDWSMLAQINRQEGGERENQGEVDTADRTRTAPNSQDQERQGVLAKLIYQANAQHRLSLIVDRVDLQTDTEVLSQQGPQTVFGQTVLTQDMDAEDRQWRERVSMEWTALPGALLEESLLRAYYQDSRTEQETFETRGTVIAGNVVSPTRRERLFQFDQRTLGLDWLGKRTIETAGADHQVTLGASLQEGRIAGLRDGRSINLTTGAISSTIFPDVFPVRDFPKSDTREWAVFVQDQIAFAEGRLQLTPGVRFDHFSLTPKPDAIFAADNPGITPVALNHAQWSPRLGALWQFSDEWSSYVQVAAGFRAPPYNDVNFGFTNVQSGYTAIPNPDLKPESSLGIEVGLKWIGDDASITFSVFDNQYDDFIESLRSLGVDSNTGLLVFQSQNIDEVRIRGAEIQGRWYLDALGADGWAVLASAAFAHGDDLTDDVPLNSVDPLRGVIGLHYDQGGMQFELVSNLAARKKRLAAIDSQGSAAFATPGYATLDAYASIPIGSAFSIDVAATNITDRQYWDWADLPALAASSTVLDRFTRPGRGYRISLNYTF
ncbi:TonB-dependent hemoglobin/transferrin/lactoferrin family receptor [Ahniella affigens]|uniref:TonB-dependent hemoglobin/transferrin/lactoferrin family receptor n=1 Tax=Ahniella affigens TaxID=2021234 RepID=A0A2P1PU34_9GAMM|nr:TonB-dependent hemoglobin/transferrin/lactoferrin family receptor [Ahniella affigens]AVP98340.1 TonB-dependent hemoglobin/transferrin/lactoferrin family receptor [Ahniella affigens]